MKPFQPGDFVAHATLLDLRGVVISRHGHYHQDGDRRWFDPEVFDVLWLTGALSSIVVCNYFASDLRRDPDKWQTVEAKSARRFGPYQTDVHTEHCCILHGCKYGDREACPVESGQKPQSDPCEPCDFFRFEDDY